MSWCTDCPNHGSYFISHFVLYIRRNKEHIFSSLSIFNLFFVKLINVYNVPWSCAPPNLHSPSNTPNTFPSHAAGSFSPLTPASAALWSVHKSHYSLNRVQVCAAVHSEVQGLCPVQKAAFHNTPPHPTLVCLLVHEYWWGGVKVRFREEHSTLWLVTCVYLNFCLHSSCLLDGYKCY